MRRRTRLVIASLARFSPLVSRLALPLALRLVSRLALPLVSRLALPLALPLALLLAACGDGGGSSPGGPDGGIPGGDAGFEYCAMQLSLTSTAESPPTTLEATATIDSQFLAGQQTFAWEVRLAGGSPVPYTPQAPDEHRITIDVTEPGVYFFVLQGSMGGVSCAPTGETVTLAPAGASQIPYRLRFVPAPGQPAITHERTETITTGFDNYVGSISLSDGVSVTGEIRTATGDPVPAYVRATRSDAVPVEAFAGGAGIFSMRLDSASYDVLIVPLPGAGALAPVRFPARPISTNWTFTLPPAQLATGIVRGPDGPLAGARVTLQIDGAPAAVAVTDAGGAFSVPVSPGSAAALLVVPPSENGLPWLELEESPALADVIAAGTPLTIAYDDALRDQTVAPTARDVGGASLAGVRATWIARAITLPGDRAAGTITATDSSLSLPLTGAVRVTATSRADGAWPALRLPEAAYDVVLEPAGDTTTGGVTVLSASIDGASTIDTLTLALPALVQGRAVGVAGENLGGILVTASPRGLLAPSPSAGAATTTAEDGTFTLPLAPGAGYEIGFESAARSHGGKRVSITAPLAGQSLDLAPVTLPEAVRLIGDVAISGAIGSAAGVTVLATCLECDFATPLAETVTDSNGTFVLAVPILPSAAEPAR